MENIRDKRLTDATTEQELREIFEAIQNEIPEKYRPILELKQDNGKVIPFFSNAFRIVQRENGIWVDIGFVIAKKEQDDTIRVGGTHVDKDMFVYLQTSVSRAREAWNDCLRIKLNNLLSQQFRINREIQDTKDAILD